MLRRIAGRSMLPTLKNGQLVVSVRRKKYSVGTIVIARTSEREVIKRISEVHRDTVCLTSDNTMEGASYTVPTKDVLGKVIWPLR